MRLDRIIITNYRSIKFIDIDFIDKVNLLIGPNGCGKTNVLEAINKLFEGFLIGSGNIGGPDFWFGKSEMIGISGNILHKELSYHVALTVNNKGVYKITPPNIVNLIGYYKNIPPNRIIRDNNIYFRDGLDFKKKFDQRYFESKYLFHSYYNLMLNSPDKLDEISKVISEIYPNFQKIYVKLDPERDYGEIIAVINDVGFNLNMLASGLQNLLMLIYDIYYSKDSIILIDEPELHMNPEMIVAIADLIKRSSEENNNQFIIGTHSPVMVSTINSNIISLEYKKTENGYSTTVTETVSNEFVNKSKLKMDDEKNV